MADQVSVEVTLLDPPIWSTAFTETQLANRSAHAHDEWFKANCDHSGWFFGTDPDMLRWTGYSVGFKLTDAFLQMHGR